MAKRMSKALFQTVVQTSGMAPKDVALASAIRRAGPTRAKRTAVTPEPEPARLNSPNPTREIYDPLDEAFNFFNERLFNGQLPYGLLTVRNHGRAFGNHSQDRIGETAGSRFTEIAMNPR